MPGDSIGDRSDCRRASGMGMRELVDVLRARWNPKRSHEGTKGDEERERALVGIGARSLIEHVNRAARVLHRC